ncbi:CPBP family intramembrane metalloprotease (plasmid) [Clostridium estertheticum]|uniref:CPBP family intramembrane glutamic endopeptidase n=1 Tax=Clostridium estertheticum TaxID=238834 RepID=UPI001C7D386A|nr:CPBP family intramembrane glutamic endopeptidase [Clostridium estertheticum]MBX4260390.1 CPBP family intramembrane metalloprotease [Clostridium estertheticum]WLC73028.1 CPBP family intramembrane metalloprotease [Clostridium estertheticum]
MKKFLKMTGNILLYSVVYLYFQVCVGFIFSIVASLKYHNLKTPTQIQNMVLENAYVLTIGAAVISLFIYYLLLRKKNKPLWERCEFKRITVKNFALIVLIALSVTFIACSFLYATQNIFKDYSSVSNNIGKGIQSIPGLVSIIILIPIFEEILFRGLIFNELRKNLNIVVSVILQAMIFGLFHGNLAQGLYTLLLGAVAAIIYIWTKSIISNIVLHICFNLAGTFIIPRILMNTTHYIYLYLITAIIVLFGLLFTLYENTHNKKQLNLVYDVGNHDDLKNEDHL